MTEGKGTTGPGQRTETRDLRWYRTLAETVDGGVYRLDADDRFVAVDDALVELTGYDREDLLGRTASSVFEDVTLVYTDESAASPGDDGVGVLERELSLRTRASDSIACDVRIAPVSSGDGETGTVGIVRAKGESDRRTNRPTVDESIEPMLDDADVGVVVLDDEFDVAWVNETTERYFGLDAETVVGRDSREVVRETIHDRIVDPDPFVEPLLETYEANDHAEQLVFRIEPGDGREERWLEHQSKPIEAGEYAGGRVELYYDVTMQYRCVTQLRRLNGAVHEWLRGTSREEVAELASRHLLDVLDLEINGVFLYDRTSNELRPVAESEPAETLFDELPTFAEGESIAWRAFETGEPIVCGDVRADDDVYNADTPIRSEIVLPMGDHGVVIVGSERENAFDDGDLMLAKIAVSSLEVTFDRIRHERSLERERTQTEKLLQTAPIAISVTDADSGSILTSRRARTADGRAVLELLDDPELLAEQRVHDADGAPLGPDETPTARVRETGEAVFDEEIAIERPSGDRAWFSVNAAPVSGSDGSLERVVATAEDITALKAQKRQLERRKSELETELSEILGRISDGFYALDEEWRFTHLNARAEAMLDHPRAELLGRVLWDVFPEAVDSEFGERIRTAMERQEPQSLEQYFEPLGLWVQVQVYPSETGLSVYFRDVTDRKERERALEKSEQRYRTLAENFPNGVVTMFDEELRYTLADGMVFEELPLSEGDLDGRRPTDVFSGSVGDELESMFRAAFDGEKRTTEVEYNGRVWLIYTTPVRGANDEVFTGLGIAQDVTSRTEYQHKLEESNERLEQFAYAASHDLQEPLRMVSSYLQLIESRYADRLDEDGEEFIAYAVDGAERMREMIDGLLAYARVETRGDPFEPVDLEDVFDAVRTDHQFRIEEADAEISATSLPTVRGDEGQLRQVFQNLLSNAIEYSGDEPPRIDVSAERSGSEWVVSVRDEGIGIGPGDADRIFEVFQRLHSQEEHDGTGIGLALTRRIVERHGGEIRVDSEPGEGATFSFTLPAVADDEQSRRTDA
jgi:PAS domain S-box-containing protein